MTDALFDAAGVGVAPSSPEASAPAAAGGTVSGMSKPTLLAVDGNSLTHRAFHAYERAGLTRSDGSPTFAVYGFFSLFAGICDKVRPDGIVVGFDDARHSIRKSAWPEYKANRSAKDPSLYVQMEEIQTVLRELGVTVVVPDGLEADDVLGSAAAAAKASAWRCVIATSDRDSFALVDESTTVLRLVSGLDNAVWVSPEKLHELYGVTGSQYPDYAALRGDSSDNLPGVRGIGEKTAAKLLAALGTVEAALADPEATLAAIGKSPAAKLAAGVDAWRHNREVMAIHTELGLDVEGCRLATGETTTATVLRRWELPHLVARMAVALAPSAAGDPVEVLEGMPEDLEEDLEPRVAVLAEAGVALSGPPGVSSDVTRARPWLVPRPRRFSLTLS